jgi:hypothetical protein
MQGSNKPTEVKSARCRRHPGDTVPKEREIWDRAGVVTGMGMGRGCSRKVHTLVGTREKASISRCDVEK